MILEQRLAVLARMSIVEKKAEWRRVHGEPAPPGFGAGLLARGIAHVLQERASGGQDKALLRRLRQLNKPEDGKKGDGLPSLKAGTWLSRTWHGETHHIVVLEKGFEYRGERYVSLSAIARQITGTGWSGPRFFGLHSPRLERPDSKADG